MPRLLGKRLIRNKPVVLGGGLVATLINWPVGCGYSVSVALRTTGAPDHRIVTSGELGMRETAELAAEDTERMLTRLASALRQAGAS